MFNIARKEFADLTWSPAIMIVLVVYLLNFVGGLSNVNYSITNELVSYESIPYLVLHGLAGPLAIGGCLVAVVVEVSSIWSERRGALNTLLVKPLYRDTVINGKLLACTLVMACINGLTISLYIPLLYLFSGDVAFFVLLSRMDRVVMLFLFSIPYSLLYISIGMLVSILVKNRSAAFLTCMIILIALNLFIGASFFGNLSGIASTLDTAWGRIMDKLYNDLNPYMLLTNIVKWGTDNPGWGVGETLGYHPEWFVMMLIYPMITTVLCYIAFIRRDVA